MSIDFAKYSEELRSLNDAYYDEAISYEDYKAQRGALFTNIEMEMRGISNQVDEASTGLLDKLLSHFKDHESNE